MRKARETEQVKYLDEMTGKGNRYRNREGVFECCLAD